MADYVNLCWPQQDGANSATSLRVCWVENRALKGLVMFCSRS